MQKQTMEFNPREQKAMTIIISSIEKKWKILHFFMEARAVTGSHLENL